jgi:hypothetical protein
MNKRRVTIVLIGGATIITGMGIVLPDLYLGITSMLMGSTSLCSALHVFKESERRKIDKVILEKLR